MQEHQRLPLERQISVFVQLQVVNKHQLRAEEEHKPTACQGNLGVCQDKHVVTLGLGLAGSVGLPVLSGDSVCASLPLLIAS